MEGGSASPAKKKLKMGEGSGAADGDVGAVGGRRRCGGSVAVGRGGGGIAVVRDERNGLRGASWSGAAGGARRSGADLAAASASAEFFDPNPKKRKNRKTRTERGLDSMKLGLRPPAFVEYDKDDASEEEPDEEVGDDKQSRDEKSRDVLRQLIAGTWVYQTEVGKYFCPFYNHVKATDYDGMVAHAIGIGSGSEGRHAHVRAKHAAYGLFLQKLQVD